MNPITLKTVKVTMGSGIVLVALALVVMIGLLYAFISVTQPDLKNWLNWLFAALYGIAVYYLAFSLLCGLLLRKKKPMPKVK